MTTRDNLADEGTELGEFNQGNFRGQYTSMEGAVLTGGYCAGVCLDWARRVLQSKQTRDERYMSYSSPKNSNVVPNKNGETRKSQTLRRMAVAYKGQGASYVGTTNKTTVLGRLQFLVSQPEVLYTIDDEDVTGVPFPNSDAALIKKLVSIDPDPFNMSMEPAGVISRQQIQAWFTHISNMADPQHSKLAAGGREWGQYATELDQKFKQIRILAGRQISKKGFCNLSVVDSRDQTTYSTPGQWRTILLESAYRDDCCTIIGVGAPDETGHAVAVHKVGGEYRFFDPNFGAFKYPTKETLDHVFQHLFSSPYWTDNGLDADLPVYRRRKATEANKPKDNKPWTSMSYTIFKAGA